MEQATARFVGRTVELGQLAELVERVRAGNGGLALVVGEPGIGKTTLVEALIERVWGPDDPVLWGQAREAPAAPPLWPWHQVGAAADRAGRPELVRVLTEATAPADGFLSAGGHDRFRRFDRVATALGAMAAAGPCLVVLDDVQWADPDLLDLLTFLAPDLRRMPVLVVATARAGDLDRMPRAERVLELGGLKRGEVADLVHSLAAMVLDGTGAEGPPLDEVVLDVIEHHTAGNPLFVAETARLLAASGRVADAEAWRRALPEGVRSVLDHRLTRLDPACRAALAAAAVLGPGARAGLLGPLLATATDEARHALAPALRAGVLLEHEPDRFTFAHDLIRRTLLDALTPADRADLHRRAALALEPGAAAIDATAAAGSGGSGAGGSGAGAERSGGAAAVAGHWLAAGEREAAAHWSGRAGEDAYRSALYADAAHWFAQARSLAPASEGPAHDLSLRLADALARSGRADEARSVVSAVVAALRPSGEPERFGRAVLRLGTIGGGFEVALLDPGQQALLAEAIDRLGPDDSAVGALLRARLSVALTLEADQEPRVALADEAVAMARRLGDSEALAAALGAWCDAHAGPRHRRERAVAAREMLGAAQRAGDPELELLARRLALVAHLEQADVPGAARQSAAFSRLADALRQPQFQWYARLAEGMLAFLRGDLDQAEARGREASDLGRRAGSANAAMLADGALLPMLSRERGDLAWQGRIEEANRDFTEAHRGADMAIATRLWSAGHGGTVAAVDEALDRAPVEHFLATTDDGLHLHYVCTMADAAAFAGRADLIPRFEAALEPYAACFVLDGTASVCYGPVALSLARMATARGDGPAAIRWYRQAIDLLRPAGARLLLARAEAELAALVVPAPATDPASAAPSGPVVRTAASDAAAVLRREGDVWLVGLGRRTARLRASKGLGDLHQLVSRPGADLHVLDLVTAAEGTTGATGRPDREGPAPVRAGANADLGPALDATARAAYEQQVRDLTADLEEAEDANDWARAARLDDERAAILAELGAALGLAGRPRSAGSDVERARKAVAMRIADALRRLDGAVPELGRHLRHSVSTGTWCSYRPELPVTWDL